MTPARTAPSEAARTEALAAALRCAGITPRERDDQADADLDLAGRPPVEPKRLARLEALLEEGLPKAATWRWLGAMSARRSEAAVARPLIPDAHRAAFDEGARLRRAVAAGLPERWRCAVRRALDALREPCAERDAPGNPLEAISIVGLVRRTSGAGRGATFDLAVEVNGRPLTLERLTPKTIASFNTVWHLALGEGVPFPLAVRGTPAAWAELIAATIEDPELCRVDSVDPGEDPIEAAGDVIREALRLIADDDDAAPAAGSLVGVTLPSGEVFVPGGELWREVSRRLPADRLDRQTVALAARAVGGLPDRRTVDGSRRRGWRFKRSDLDRGAAA